MLLPVPGTPGIPDHELWFEFSRATGPGGQNVNKVSTRATLCFCLDASGALDDAQKTRARLRLAARLATDGVLRVDCQETRSQARNRDLARERLAALLADAIRPPKRRGRTRPTAGSRQKRLQEKKRRSGILGNRRTDAED